jgi:hypothetical protein
MPGDFLTDDIPSMLLTAEFADEATLIPRTGSQRIFNGILNEILEAGDQYREGGIVDYEAIFTCSSSDASGIKLYDTLLIRNVYYEVTNDELPDSTGVSDINLRRDPKQEPGKTKI